jgi:peptide/nickel transport system permease protein
MTQNNPNLGKGRAAITFRPPSFAEQTARFRAKASDRLCDMMLSKTTMIGGIMLIVLFAVLILTPWIAQYDPIKQDYVALRQNPGLEHWFGTDRYGRDIFSRVLWGGRRLVVIAMLAVGVGLLIGIPFGVLSGYRGGRVDAFCMRFIDGLLAFPGILLYLLVVTLTREWGLEGAWNDAVLIFALGFSFFPEVARLTRSSVLVEKRKEYVEAARSVGESGVYIAMREVLPNCLSPLIVNSTVRLGYMILVIAALSFLGLGTPPPTPDWGTDLSTARAHLESNPLIAVFPGLAICYTVLAFNLFGDGLRDVIDPRLSER